MYCSQCGAKLPETARFCPSCGRAVSIDVMSNNELASAAQVSSHVLNTKGQLQESDELFRFVGEKFEYYRKKWEISDAPEKKISWNWAAFFLSIFWMGYRKMYGYVLIVNAMYLLVDLIFFLLPNSSHANNSIGIAINVVCGLWGNSMYYVFAKKRISTIKSAVKDETARYAALQKAGGTSWYGVLFTILIAFLYAAISTTISYLIGAEDFSMAP